MAKAGNALSFRKKDAIDVGLFSSGPAVVKEAVFTPYNYKGGAKPVDVILLTFSRDGEEDYGQPYGIGKGWKISADGTELIPKNGQTGLGKTCNAMMYLIAPLEAALPKADLDPDDYLGEGFPGTLVGLEVVVARVNQVERENQKKRDDGSPRTILVIEEITGTEGGKKKKGATGAKAKAKPVDDDEDDDEPVAKKKKPADDDDDEEEPVAKKKKKAADDDEDDDEALKAKSKKKGANDDDELLEEGVEALISALETEDGPIKLDALDDALDVALKGNKNRKAIIALMTDVDVLALEKGWTFNEKKKTITLDK